MSTEAMFFLLLIISNFIWFIFSYKIISLLEDINNDWYDKCIEIIFEKAKMFDEIEEDEFEEMKIQKTKNNLIITRCIKC